MSDIDILKKYDTHENLVATEDDLKSLTLNKPASTEEGKLHPQNTEVTKQVQFEKKDLTIAPTTEDELNTDYQYIRNNLYTITERSIDALNNLAQIADQSQHPRAYEVVALLVNTIANAQKDLLGIHTARVKINAINNKNNKSADVVNNNLFVGNTAQLDEIIKKMTGKSDE